ncbi:hypothetical protein [Povalibacter sp.]|uniref:hypothetical protein n=1 Tax=Povalibacter sp. TaxID=1962978 RepID=UPI002F42268E
MAKPQSTSGARARKNRRIDPPPGASGLPKDPGFRTRPSDSSAADSEPVAQSLNELIESERGRLAQAQSMLSCLHTALLVAEQESRHEPGSADVLAMGLRLVRQAISRLDALYLQPLIDALSAGTSTQTRRRSAALRR